MKNFETPYFSTSISEFWSRWHISLSTWFKDYVYIPLGGNRVPLGRHFLNLLLVFLLSGFWHGASWTFVVWGALHGLYLIVERSAPLVKRYLMPGAALRPPDVFAYAVKLVLTFHLVLVSWIFFRADHIGTACAILRKIIFDHGPLFWDPFIAQGVLAIGFLLLLDIFNRPTNYWQNLSHFAAGFRLSYALSSFSQLYCWGSIVVHSLSTFSSEKLLVKKCIIGLLLVVCLDQIIGAGLSQIYQRTMTGEASGGLINYALTKAPDILILGSSRARHHINPAILHHRLSVSAFNAGVNGHDLLYAMMLFDLRKRFHTPPRAIILHVDAASFVKEEEELQRTSIFSYYVNKSDLVRHVIFSRSRYEPLKFLSSAYRFNGKLLPMLKNQFVSVDAQADGYVGLSGHLKWTEPSPDEDDEDRRMAALPFWQDKIAYFRDLATYCKQHETQLFLVHSPRFREDPVGHAAWTRNLSRLLVAYPEIEFIDISEQTYPEVFVGRVDLYRDVSHLNVHGAELFSQLLATALEHKLTQGAKTTHGSTRGNSG